MQLSFKALDAGFEVEREEWCRLWTEWPDQEVFAHPDYLRLFARDADRVICLVGSAGGVGILFPFILRRLDKECWAETAEPIWDLVGPYGYGGIFHWGVCQSVIDRFQGYVDQWMQEAQVVSCFVRLSLFPDQAIAPAWPVDTTSRNVVRGLEVSDDELWGDYEHKVRKNVRRATQSGLRFLVDHDGSRLEEFKCIYYATMRRREAAHEYYFPPEFFDSLLAKLRGHCLFFHVLRGDEIISTELALLSRYYVYSFLGGTIAESFDVRPNDFLKHELAIWARGIGKKAYVLGGGYESDDGLFRYKRSFAPNGIVDFRVCRKICDLAVYEMLVARRRVWECNAGNDWSPRPKFFPAYRA